MKSIHASVIALAVGCVVLPESVNAASFYWTSAVDGNWSSTSPNGWTRIEAVGPSRPGAGAATDAPDTALIDATGAAYTITKGSNHLGSLSSFLLNSADATINLNASAIRGLKLADGADAEIRNGTFRITRGSNSQGAFYINDAFAAGTYSAALRIGTNGVVDLANTAGGFSPLTYVPANGGRVYITEQKGLISVGTTDPGVGINSLQHLVVSDGFTNEGTIRLSNTRPGIDNAGASNSIFEIGTGTLLNKGTIELLTGASNGADTLFIDPNTYEVNQRNLIVTLNNDSTGLLSVGNVGAQEAKLGRSTAASHSNSGNIAIVSGATLALTSDNTLDNLAGGVIRGGGTLDVSASGAGLTNGGELSPGASAGSLTIVGGFTSTDSAQLNIELGGTTAGLTYDQLIVTGGTAGLDGELDVSFLDSFVPASSDVFVILSGLNTGTFDNVIGGKLNLGNGYTFDVTYNSASVELSNYALVPEPTSMALLGLGLSALVRRRRS